MRRHLSWTYNQTLIVINSPYKIADLSIYKLEFFYRLLKFKEDEKTSNKRVVGKFIIIW